MGTTDNLPEVLRRFPVSTLSGEVRVVIMIRMEECEWVIVLIERSVDRVTVLFFKPKAVGITPNSYLR